MQFDIFFSICQTEVDNYLPSEQEMFDNFFSQALLADELGYGTAWIAETHLSCEVQKRNSGAVIPEFKGEIGLNTDILQMAHLIFSQTKRIQVGSAIRNILCNGGPIAHAEAIRTFLSLHSAVRKNDPRKLEIGFAAGRFEFSNIPYGITPRNEVEKSAWPVMKGKIFHEATEIFLRLLKGEIISSKEISARTLSRSDFRNDQDWQKVLIAHGKQENAITIPNRWQFPYIQTIPKHAPLDHLRLTIGTHDAETQKFANTLYPCGVFNLSITPSAQIEKTHAWMQANFHRDGGEWKREYMPRTILVFLNNNPRLSETDKNLTAQAEAHKAIANYWKAMEGTLDEEKVKNAVHNALVGSPKEIIRTMKEKFHVNDRLMLWFDFNNHNNSAVQQSMKNFMSEVAPHV